MGLSRGHWMPFLGGVVMGGAIIYTMTLIFWSTSPSLLSEIPVAHDDRSFRTLRQERGSSVGGDSNKERCVCSSEEITTSKATLTKGTVSEATDKIAMATPTTSPTSMEEQRKTILQSLTPSRRSQDNLVVGVVKVGDQLEWAESVLETWGQEVKQLIFYNSQESNMTVLQARALGLQLVELRPPVTPTTLVLQLYVLLHMTHHFLNSHLWFLVVTSHTYVQLRQLEHVLDSLDEEAPLIIGPDPHCWEREVGVAQDAAILASRGLMKLLDSCLISCTGHTHSEECLHDSSVGVCMEHIVRMYCLPVSKLSEVFVESSSVPLSSQLLKTNTRMFSSLITYSPVKQRDDLHLLQHHYKRAELEVSLATTQALELEVKELCSSSKSGSFYSPSEEEDCTVSVCACQSSSPSLTAQCPPSGVISDIPTEFQSRTIYDYYPWEYFDVKMIYEEASVQPNFILKTKRNTKMELQHALTRAIQNSCKEYGKPLKFKKLVNGWVRHNPYVGSEYIIDYQLMDGSRNLVSHRVSLVRPLAKNFITEVGTFDTLTTVHFLVPLSKVTERFEEFMSMYETLVLAEEREAELVLCVYGDNDVRHVRQIIEEYRQRYKDMQVKVLEGKGKFSRARALDLGFSSLTPHQLAFICDVDMIITKSFLDRCRSNAVEGKRVYYPEFFKLYNMDYVYWNRSKPLYMSLQREHGHWAYYSFGMLCIYKSDYVRVGGFDTSIVGWGGEDVSLFNRIVRSRLKVLRAPDIALSHRWHPKECASSLSRKQLKQCQSSRVENLADRKELARYLYGKGLVKTTAELTKEAELTTPIYHQTNHKPSKLEQITSNFHKTSRKSLNPPIQPIGADYDI